MYPSEQLMAVKSGLQTSMKCGRSRPTDSLPTSVMLIVTDRPNNNRQNTRSADVTVSRQRDVIDVTSLESVRRRDHVTADSTTIS